MNHALDPMEFIVPTKDAHDWFSPGDQSESVGFIAGNFIAHPLCKYIQQQL